MPWTMCERGGGHKCGICNRRLGVETNRKENNKNLYSSFSNFPSLGSEANAWRCVLAAHVQCPRSTNAISRCSRARAHTHEAQVWVFFEFHLHISFLFSRVRTRSTLRWQNVSSFCSFRNLIPSLLHFDFSHNNSFGFGHNSIKGVLFVIFPLRCGCASLLFALWNSFLANDGRRTKTRGKTSQSKAPRKGEKNTKTETMKLIYRWRD